MFDVKSRQVSGTVRVALLSTSRAPTLVLRANYGALCLMCHNV